MQGCAAPHRLAAGGNQQQRQALLQLHVRPRLTCRSRRHRRPWPERSDAHSWRQGADADPQGCACSGGAAWTREGRRQGAARARENNTAGKSKCTRLSSYSWAWFGWSAQRPRAGQLVPDLASQSLSLLLMHLAYSDGRRDWIASGRHQRAVHIVLLLLWDFSATGFHQHHSAFPFFFFFLPRTRKKQNEIAEIKNCRNSSGSSMLLPSSVSTIDR